MMFWKLSVAFVICFGVFIIVGVPMSIVKRYQEMHRLHQQGYDVDDVDVFVHSIGNTFTDFLRSPGLRKQYELYQQGISSDYQQQARAVKNAEDAQDSGFSSGVVTGIAIGSSHHAR